MKIIAKPVECIAWFDKTGMPHPVRFRVAREDESEAVIKVDKVVTVDKEKLAGNPMLVFQCKSIIKGIERPFELKYELGSCKWMLWKNYFID